MSQNALVQDIVQFACAESNTRKNFRRMLLEASNIYFTHAADLVLYLNRGPQEMVQPVQSRFMGRKIKQLIHARCGDSFSSLCSSSTFSVSLLAPVLSEFTGTHVDQTTVDQAWTHLNLHSQNAKQVNSPSASSTAVVSAKIEGGVVSAQSAAQSESNMAVCVQQDAEYIRYYKDWAPEDLAVLVHNKDMEVEELQQQVHQEHKARLEKERQLARVQDNLSAVKDELTLATALHRDMTGQHISVLGGYTLACRRSYGNSGADVAARMIQGESSSSKRTLIKFEHRAACAKKLLAKNEYAGFDQLVEAADQPEQAEHEFFDTEVHLYKGDGTQQEAIERKKAHLGYVSSMCLSRVTLNKMWKDIQEKAKAAEEMRAAKKAEIEEQVRDLSQIYSKLLS